MNLCIDTLIGYRYTLLFILLLSISYKSEFKQIIDKYSLRKKYRPTDLYNCSNMFSVSFGIICVFFELSATINFLFSSKLNIMQLSCDGLALYIIDNQLLLAILLLS